MKPIIPDDLTIPTFLRRIETAESKAARARIVQEMWRALKPAMRKQHHRQTISAGASEINSKETKMAKIGKKEQALKDSRTSDAKLAKAAKDSGAFDVIGGALATPKVKVSDVTDIPDSEIFGGMIDKAAKKEVNAANERIAKAAKKVAATKPAAAARKPAGKPAAKAKGVAPAAAKKAPATPVKAKSGEPWPKPGTKQAAMLDMVKRKEGASEKAICAKLKWKRCRVTLGRVVKAAGLKLEHQRIGDETIYYAK